jgi:excisionase family DNA binding protein
MSSQLNPLAVGPAEGARLLGISRTSLYRAIKAGDLKPAKHGRRTLLTVASLHAYLAKLGGAA